MEQIRGAAVGFDFQKKQQKKTSTVTLYKHLVSSSVLIEDKNVTWFDLHKKYLEWNLFIPSVVK